LRLVSGVSPGSEQVCSCAAAGALSEPCAPAAPAKKPITNAATIRTYRSTWTHPICRGAIFDNWSDGSLIGDWGSRSGVSSSGLQFPALAFRVPDRPVASPGRREPNRRFFHPIGAKIGHRIDRPIHRAYHCDVDRSGNALFAAARLDGVKGAPEMEGGERAEFLIARHKPTLWDQSEVRCLGVRS
jgi:hypothetical protein